MEFTELSRLLLTVGLLLTVFQALIPSVSSACDITKNTLDEEDDEHALPGDYEQHLRRTLKGEKCKKSKQQYRTFSDLGDGGVVPLDCGRCLVSHVQVKVTHGTECVGRTPELYSSKLNCMWKNSCKLEYTPSTIITPDGNFNCLLQVPQRMDVGYSCVNTKKTPITDVIPLTTVDASRGLLRSHDRKESTDYPTDSLLLENHTFTVRAPESMAVTYALMKILTYDVISDNTLTVYNGICPETPTISVLNRTEGAFDLNVTGHSLTFEFKVNDTSSGYNGFDICFQWFGLNETSQAVAAFEKTVKLCRANAKVSKEDVETGDFSIVDVIQTLTSRHPVGIVRSHPYYPWNYRPIVSKTYLEEATDKKPSWTSVHRKLLAPPKKTMVRLTLKNMSLGPLDRLVVVDDKGNAVDLQDNKAIIITTTSLHINFTTKDTSRPTGNGFLLYYQWLSWKEDREAKFDLQANVCKRLPKQAPSECRVKKRKVKGGKKGKRNKNPTKGKKNRKRKGKRRNKKGKKGSGKEKNAGSKKKKQKKNRS